MTTLDVGLGIRRIAARRGAGRVVAVYRAAAYLRFPAGLLAMTSGAAPSGPLHLRVAVLPRLDTGDPVEIDPTGLRGRHWSVPLDAPTWTGEVPDGDAVARPQCPDGPDEPIAELLRAGDLATLAGSIGGRGPGLTPSGDDVLAGVLLVARARWGPAAEPDLLAVAGSVVTTDVAVALLFWAARGQCIEPAHSWLTARAKCDDTGATQALARLQRVGASSGRALRRGLELAAAQLPGSEIHTALASERPGFDQWCGWSVG